MGHEALLEQLIPIARAAGAAILEVYATDFDVMGKDDGTPVTEADHRAESIILKGLARLTPGIPVVSEEAGRQGHELETGATFWLVDPLDGTREFISRNGEFTVNIALVEDGSPRLGIVLAPVPDRLYGGTPGGTSFVEDARVRRIIRCVRSSPDGLVVVSSRSHGEAKSVEDFLAGRKVASYERVGSSLKFCLVACGQADLYPRLGPTMEWDTAAGHAVLLAAGGMVRSLEGTYLTYGKKGFRNPPFIASGGDS